MRGERELGSETGREGKREIASRKQGSEKNERTRWSGSE